MASKGKKGKGRGKGVVLNLNDFLANGGGTGAYRAPSGGGETNTVAVEVSNWADEMDEYDDRPKQTVVLPTAPRAALGPEQGVEERIPQDPPYTAYIANLPYDVDEEAVEQVFKNCRLKIKDVRLMKEEGGRLRGYGYADFEDRQSLIDVLTMSDLTVNNRKIRIDLATSAGKDGQKGGYSDRGGFGGREDRNFKEDPDAGRSEVDCWRSGPPPPEREVRGGGGRDRDGGGFGGRDREGGSRGFGNYEPARGYDRDRDGGRDGARDGGRGYGFGERGGDRGSRYGDRDSRRSPEAPRERPKLALAPRSKPIEASESEAPPPSIFGGAKPVDTVKKERESIFGGAKPVDTVKKERELEEKLAEEKAAKLKREEEARKNKPSAASIFGGAKPVDTSAREKEIEQKLSRLTVVDRERDRSRDKSSEGEKEKRYEAAPAPTENAWRRKPEVRAGDEPASSGVYRPPRRDGLRDDYRREDRDGRRDDYRRDDRDRRRDDHAPHDYGRDDRRGDRDGPRRDDGLRDDRDLRRDDRGPRDGRDDVSRRDDRDGRRDDRAPRDYGRDDRREDRDGPRRDDGPRRSPGEEKMPAKAKSQDRDGPRRDDGPRRSPGEEKMPEKAKSPPPIKQYEEPKAPVLGAPNKFALLQADDADSASEED